MKKRISFKGRILINFSVVIAIFTVGIILFEQDQIKKERTESLERTLENNADIIHSYLNQNNILSNTGDISEVEEQLSYMQDDLRLTIISWQGDVLYDNLIERNELENHLDRPEIKTSIAFGSGSNIRISDSNNIEYLYYAKKYTDGAFIRLALPYNVEIKSFINAENSFAFFILLFFLVCVLMMLYFTNRFTKSIRELREFSISLNKGMPIPADFTFADDEVGEVSADIVENYKQLRDNQRKLATEREKLLQHFQYSEEGIAIFSKERKKIYTNSHFLQYLNIILNTPTLEIEQLFNSEEFSEIVAFLDNEEKTSNVFSQRFDKSGKQFNVRVIIFDDDSFEFYISDITKSEKTRLLKQEMTNNIAHELRTPVTSIRGYLETIINLYQNDEEHEKIPNFINRAYVQTIQLSELIQDISMLTKIEEASDRFEKEPVNLKELLDGLNSDLNDKLVSKGDKFKIEVKDNVVVYGSRTLLYSIFRNLTENSIAYAGENVEIVIKCYSESSDSYYFEFYDTGKGIEDKHLVRVFERFYRINEGRTRNSGGSGLGLSIVKNAVLFHKGSIVAKNRIEGGLSFLITFPKNK